MGLRGNLNNLRDLKKNLRKAPISLANDVAAKATPELTRMTQSAFDSGRTVYNQPRPRGVDGETLTLVRTGDVRRMLSFARSGTIMRAILGTPYAKYLIGKYDILPNGPLPSDWRKKLQEVTSEAQLEL